MLLKEVVQNPVTLEDGSVTMPRAMSIKASTFKNLWTVKNSSDAVNNSVLVDRIADMWSGKLSGNLEPEITEIYVPKNCIYNIDTKKRVISEASDHQLAEMDIESLAISRAIAKIEVQGLSGTTAPAIAININEKGEEFGWGVNVSLCSNMTIMSYEHLVSTYRKIRGAGGSYTKMNLENIMGQMERYMEDMDKQFEEEQKQIAVWKEHFITRDEYFRFMGMQFNKIQVVNHHRVQRRIEELEDKELAVNGVQLGRIAVEANNPSYEDYKWDEENTSLWNVINWGTEVLKFQNGSDSATVLEANRNWIQAVDGFSFN